MTFFVKYDLATGAFRGSGSCSSSQVAGQASEGQGVVEVEADVLVYGTGDDGNTVLSHDFTSVRNTLRNKVDQEAGRFRRRFITDVPGQAQTYERKEREARSFQAGDPPASVPFLAAEAELRGIPILQVKAEVMAQVNAIMPLAAKVEAHRVYAKLQIQNAVSIGEMVAASQVDWEALLPE